MSKYGSLLFPSPTEFHEIGPFRFPIHKELCTGEIIGFEKIDRQQSKVTLAQMKLVRRISRDKKVTPTEAQDMLSKMSDDENSNLLFDYVDEFSEVQNAGISITQTQISYVTVLMQYRGQVKMPKVKDWIQTRDWTQEDTEDLPSEIRANIYQFILWERDGWPVAEPEGKQEEPELEPALVS
jgi:hypothetical protein